MRASLILVLSSTAAFCAGILQSAPDNDWGCSRQDRAAMIGYGNNFACAYKEALLFCKNEYCTDQGTPCSYCPESGLGRERRCVFLMASADFKDCEQFIIPDLVCGDGPRWDGICGSGIDAGECINAARVADDCFEYDVDTECCPGVDPDCPDEE